MNKRTFEDIIAQDGKLVYVSEGDSMYPTILRLDLLVIERAEKPLKVNDIPLYKRASGQYVLHRIVEVKRGKYVTKGDNRTAVEKGVTDSQIVGVLTSIIRGGKTFPAGKPREHEREAAMDLIYLLSCAVNGNTPDAERIQDMDLLEIFRQSRQHFLTSAVSYALEKTDELPKAFDQARKKAIRKQSLFDIERAEILKALEENEIWYMPLKGVLLKDDYPKSPMREMGDNDILVDPTRMDDVRGIMERFGYKCLLFGEYNHDVYSKAPVLEFEMHRSLFYGDNMPLFADYYANIHEKLLRDGFKRKMTDEDFYIYMLAHAYKHYIHAGTGLRSLLDIYVFLRAHPDLNREYLGRELEKLQISRFERSVSSLAQKAFTCLPLSDSEQKELDYFIFSGIYGIDEHAQYHRMARNLGNSDSRESKREYLKRRVLISGEALKKNYPFVHRHKWLYPLLVVYRPIKGVVKRPKAIIAEYKEVRGFQTDSRLELK